MSEQFTIAIIISLWNKEKKIKRAIESCLNQTYPIDEIIVVDDGSTDNSAQIVKEISKDYPQVKYYYQENQGAQRARNRGIKKANSDLVGVLDADDLFLPQKIELQVKEMMQSGADIVSCYIKRVYPDGREIEYEWDADENVLSRLLHYQTYVTTDAPIFKRHCFEKIQFDENCPSSQELELHINMAQHFKYSYVPEILSIYDMEETEHSVFRTTDKIFDGFYYIFTKYKVLWIRTTGKDFFYQLTQKLLYYNWINSKHFLKNYFKLLKLDLRYTKYIFKPIFYKELIKRMIKKNGNK